MILNLLCTTSTALFEGQQYRTHLVEPFLNLENIYAKCAPTTLLPVPISCTILLVLSLI